MSFLYRAGRALPKIPVRSLTSSLRQSILPARTGFLQPSLKTISRPTYSAFSTSCLRLEPAGESDVLLSAKLASEQSIEIENQERDSTTLPANLQDFITNSPFEIKDVPGSEVVTLTRTFGNETIKIEFSVADMNDNSYDEQSQMEEDSAFEDEGPEDMDMTSAGKKTINQSGKAADIMPEDQIAPVDREDEMAAGEDAATPAYEVDLKITITKPSAGAVQISAAATDGIIAIDDVQFFPEAELANALTHEDERKQAKVYKGPPFQNLDQDLQSLLEQYVDERGINQLVAGFVPDYVEYKEQREYVQWLQSK
jgi:complement component 1 Q subcomponent-binding protein